MLAAGLAVERVQVNPGFARLIVSSADDRTELDLAADARLFPAESGSPAPTLRVEELAVDKLLALFGRAEARDFVDLMAVEPRYGLDRLCELAAEKDRGFSPAVFANMLARFDRLRRAEFDLDDAPTNNSPTTSSAGASTPSRSHTAPSSRTNATSISTRVSEALRRLQEVRPPAQMSPHVPATPTPVVDTRTERLDERIPPGRAALDAARAAVAGGALGDARVRHLLRRGRRCCEPLRRHGDVTRSRPGELEAT